MADVEPEARFFPNLNFPDREVSWASDCMDRPDVDSSRPHSRDATGHPPAASPRPPRAPRVAAAERTGPVPPPPPPAHQAVPAADRADVARNRIGAELLALRTELWALRDITPSQDLLIGIDYVAPLLGTVSHEAFNRAPTRMPHRAFDQIIRAVIRRLGSIPELAATATPFCERMERERQLMMDG